MAASIALRHGGAINVPERLIRGSAPYSVKSLEIALSKNVTRGSDATIASGLNAETSLSSIRVVSPQSGDVQGVGKYRYIGKLAEGGMADVFLAVTQSTGFEKLVVIKQLRPDLGQDESFIQMFMDEARLAARLNHPNVVQTLEVGTDDHTPLGRLHFIAMEFLEGVAYVRFARKKEQLPAPLSYHLRIIIDTLRGLHYAHELRDFDGRPLNVVHRDVSPQNVMLTWAGGVKVLDFGIAKAELAIEARPEDFKGKLEYMAPEQALQLDVDRRADIFSVGVMLHEALTRRRLFRKGDDKLAMLTEGRLPHVLDVAPTTPRHLADVCMRAMAHDREHRYATADAMADDLEEWLAKTQQVSARDVGSYVAEMFASTRAKITAAVEEQLAMFRRLAASPQQGMMPLSRLPFTEFPPEPDTWGTVPPGPMNTGLSGETYRGLGQPVPPDAPSTIRDLAEPQIPTYSRPPRDLTGPQVPFHPRPSIDVTGPMLPAYQRPSIAPPAPTPPRSRSNLALVLVSTALVGVLLAGGAMGVMMYRAKKMAPPPPPPAVTVSAPPPAPPPDVDYSIRATPTDAKLFLDGQPLANPATGKHAVEHEAHTLKVEASGFEPREESVTFDRSLLISIELHAVAPPDAGPKKKKK
jgi:serine/threonine-protein kinase